MLGRNNVSSKASPYNYQGTQKIIGVALLIADTRPANSTTMHSRLVHQDRNLCLSGTACLLWTAVPFEPTMPKRPKKKQKCAKSCQKEKKFQKVPKSAKRVRFYYICSTICTHQEIQCLPYAGFFFYTINVSSHFILSLFIKYIFLNF